MRMLRPQNSRNESHSVGVCPASGPPSRVVPARNKGCKKCLQRLSADPRLNAEPAARDDRPHQCRQIRSDRAVRSLVQKPETECRTLVPGCELSKYRSEHDRIAEQDREQRLPPVHPRRDQPRRHHIGRDAMGHRDPQCGVVVRRPVAFRDRHGCEVFVIERQILEFAEGLGL